MKTIDDEIFDKLKIITRRLYNMGQEIEQSLNIGHSECKILSAFFIEDKLSQTAISDICDLDKPATSRLVRKLEEKNLIIKCQDVNDKRITYISLSEEGEKLSKQILNKMCEFRYKYFNTLSEEDKRLKLEILNKFIGDVKC